MIEEYQKPDEKLEVFTIRHRMRAESMDYEV